MSGQAWLRFANRHRPMKMASRVLVNTTVRTVCGRDPVVLEKSPTFDARVATSAVHAHFIGSSYGGFAMLVCLPACVRAHPCPSKASVDFAPVKPPVWKMTSLPKDNQ
jgi:hypothetical protein